MMPDTSEAMTVEQLAELLNGDTTTAAAERFVAALDSAARDRVMDAIRSRDEAALFENICKVVRDKLAEMGLIDTTYAVVFSAYDWDNGDFLKEDGAIHLVDGTSDEAEFNIRYELTQAYGRVASHAALAIVVAGSSKAETYKEFYDDDRNEVVEEAKLHRWYDN